MRHSEFNQALREPLRLFVENWRTQFIIYGTTLIVALGIALVADIGFGMPVDEVVELTILSTLALLMLVPLRIIASRHKSSVRRETVDPSHL